jgi:hypothetical protein
LIDNVLSGEKSRSGTWLAWCNQEGLLFLGSYLALKTPSERHFEHLPLLLGHLAFHLRLDLFYDFLYPLHPPGSRRTRIRHHLVPLLHRQHHLSRLIFFLPLEFDLAQVHLIPQVGELADLLFETLRVLRLPQRLREVRAPLLQDPRGLAGLTRLLLSPPDAL